MKHIDMFFVSMKMNITINLRLRGKIMGLFDSLIDIANSVVSNSSSNRTSGFIDYGSQKNDGSHDHRYNRGEDRTRAQKGGDKKRKKDN